MGKNRQKEIIDAHYDDSLEEETKETVIFELRAQDGVLPNLTNTEGCYDQLLEEEETELIVFKNEEPKKKRKRMTPEEKKEKKAKESEIKQARKAEQKALVDKFNSLVKVGQEIRFKTNNGEVKTGKVSSKAWMLAGHTAFCRLSGMSNLVLIQNIILD